MHTARSLYMLHCVYEVKSDSKTSKHFQNETRTACTTQTMFVETLALEVEAGNSQNNKIKTWARFPSKWKLRVKSYDPIWTVVVSSYGFHI